MVTTCRWVFFLVLSLTIARAEAVRAQVGGTLPTAQPPAPAAAAPPPAPVAPDSPRAALRTFLDASREGRWDAAARFLSLDDTNRARGPELARRLHTVIESHYLLDPDSLAAASEGRLDDNLPADVEEIARVEIDNVQEPMRLVRSSEVSDVPWVFAPATVARIDAWYGDLRTGWIRDDLIEAGLPFLLEEGPFDILWWQWIALPFLALLSWGIGRVLRAVAGPLIGLVTARTTTVWDDRILASIGPPLTLAFAVVVFTIFAVLIELSRSGIQVLTPFARAGTSLAFFWALWRSTAVLLGWASSRPWAVNSASARNLLAIGSNLSRGIIVGIGILSVLASLGYPMGTVLTGLGIGGLALAFGAQKTVENVFGSISLAVDQPFRVGDVVRIEDYVGTVEDIGLRSTRIRTPDRTLVSIPNGKVADQRVESLQARDRMRLAATFGLRYETTRAQMQVVLDGVEHTLRSHPRIWPEGVTVYFKQLGPSSLDIEVGAWFQVPTWDDFQQCRQEVLLRFMEVVENAGTSFAFPTRTVHLVDERGSAADVIQTRPRG